MKLITTLLITVFISATLLSQIVIDPDIIMFEPIGEESIDVKINVTNNTDEFTEIYWMFEKGENYPEEWGTTICDARICYLEDIFKSNMNLPNQLDPSQTMIFKFTIATNGVEGSSYGILHLYSDSKCENEVAVSKSPISSVSDELIESIVIYPNPASEYFQINNDNFVKSVEVTNIIGRTFLSENHAVDKMYAISHLPNGVFFVILRDENNKKIKTLRLIK